MHSVNFKKYFNEIITQHNGLGRPDTIASVLKKLDCFSDCMVLHHYIVQNGDDSSLFLASHLLHCYLRWKYKEDGWAFFVSMHDRNVYSWNHLIQSYMKDPYSDDGSDNDCDGIKILECFNRMQEESVLPNRTTFASVISGQCEPGELVQCELRKSIQCEKQIERMHACIACSQHQHEIMLCTLLLKKYGQFGRLEDALSIFNILIARDVVIWTTLIICFAEKGHIKESLQFFHQMQEEGIVRPNNITFIGILAEYAKYGGLEEGQLIHYHILVEGLETDIAISNALINMYGKRGSLDDAIQIFDIIPDRNVVTWTSVITLYTQKGYGKVALTLFDKMLHEGMLPNNVTLVNLIVACACRPVLKDGKYLHARIVHVVSKSDVVIAASLVNMYDKCGSISDARRVFDGIIKRDLVLWNTMISVYAQNSKAKEAIELFESMQAEGLHPDNITFSNIFSVCADTAEQAEGERMHAYIMESGLEVELIVGNSLIHMYAHCDDLDRAEAIFNNLRDRDVVSWTVMIAAHILHGQHRKSIHALNQMQLEGILPDKVTFLSMLDVSCNDASASDVGNIRYIKTRISKSGFESEITIQNAFINLCDKRGNVQEAEEIFDMMSERDVVSWNAMIALYSHHGTSLKKTLDVFSQMLDQNVMPDKITIINILSSCTKEALLSQGNHFCMWVMENAYDLDVVLVTALITMYGKCGSLNDAKCCFQYIDMEERSALTWNAMMGVYSLYGQGREAIQHFIEMQQERNVALDQFSFLALLVACSHNGLADDGQKLFVLMVDSYGIIPGEDHYACMVDLFGRVGRVEEAEALSYTIPSQPSVETFKRVLSACRPNSDVKRGEHVVRHATELEANSTSVDVAILYHVCSSLRRDQNNDEFEDSFIY